MAFKGTAVRDTRQLEQEVEDMGGHLNAYTSREQTCYYARVFSGDVARAVDILADILQNSKLDEGAIERERDVILREMQEVEGVPEEVVFDHLHATAFQQTPLGRTILGPAANVKSLTRCVQVSIFLPPPRPRSSERDKETQTLPCSSNLSPPFLCRTLSKLNRDDLKKYIDTNYVAPRMVVAAAGGVDHDQLVKLAAKAFGGLPSGEGHPTTGQLVAASPAHFTGSEVRLRDPDMSKLHFAVAFKGASWGDADAVPLMVIQSMLGAWDKHGGAGGAASPMLAQRASANGLCDSYMAFNTNYHDAGLFGVYAVADPGGPVDDLAWSVMRDVSGLCYGAGDADVERAKTQLKASLLFAGDGPAGVAEEIGRQLLVYGRRVPLAEMLARVDAVTPAKVQEVARRFIFDQDVAIAALGDTQNLPDYTYFRRRTYWLRY